MPGTLQPPSRITDRLYNGLDTERKSGKALERNYRSADEVETMFLYLCRESPGMLQESGALPTMPTQTKEEVKPGAP